MNFEEVFIFQYNKGTLDEPYWEDMYLLKPLVGAAGDGIDEMCNLYIENRHGKRCKKYFRIIKRIRSFHISIKKKNIIE